MYKPLYTTPILFIIHNKADQILKAFEEIRKIRPEKLYLSCDGYYSKGNKQVQLVPYVQNLIDKVDWECKVVSNLRKRRRNRNSNVIESVEWFFKNETEGVILEDNCVATSSFFHFCTILLNVYRHDSSIGHIGGNNFFNIKTEGNYLFSKYPQTYGWATWKRAWELAKSSKNDFTEFMISSQSYSFFNSIDERAFFYCMFENETGNGSTNWVYLWMHSLWKNKMKSIIPPLNMVKVSSVVIKSDKWITYVPSNMVTEIIHPVSSHINPWVENLIYEKMYKQNFLRSQYYRLKYKWMKYMYQSTQEFFNQ